MCSRSELNKILHQMAETYRAIYGTEIALKYLKVFSIIDVSYKGYTDWKNISPFYKNVSEEGAVLYAA